MIRLIIIKKRNIRPKKSKNLHSTVAVIISYDYHKGKFETKAQILGMRPVGAAAVLTVRVEILTFIHKRRLQIILQTSPLVIE